MPRRTKSYNEWLFKKLADPLQAQRYLKTAMQDSPARFFKALGKVAEANRMAKIAEEVGVSRESLYKSLSETGNPAYRTIESVLNAFGMAFDLKLLEPPTSPITQFCNAPIQITTTVTITMVATTAPGVNEYETTPSLRSGNYEFALNGSIPYFLLPKGSENKQVTRR